MFVLKKLDIRTFPFQECSNLSNSDLEVWAKDVNLSGHNTWMLPQMQAVFGNFKVSKTDSGQYDPKLLMKDNIVSEWDKGLWRIVTKLKRSSFVKTQIHPDFSQYSALVPLIISGLKKFREIQYSQWASEGLEYTMDSNLYEAATWTAYYDLGSEELFTIRQLGLTTKSGSSMGEIKKPTSAWCLTGIKGTALELAPKLTGTMLTQIWVAHPTIRNNLMILDPKNWDNMPEPIIKTESVLKPTNTNKSDNEATDKMPWEI